MKALSVGGAMIDTIAIIESERIERMSMLNAEASFLLIEEGRKTEALEVSTHCGGGAVNTAVAMSRLGLDVSTLLKLGRDARADVILAGLNAEGISTRWVIRDASAPTGASVLISSHDRNAAVFTFRGANTLLEPGDLPDEAFAADLVYVSGLSNRSADCFPVIIDKAKDAGALVAVNAGVRQLSARGGAFLDSLGRIDILAINRAEADALVPGLVAKFGEGGSALTLDAWRAAAAAVGARPRRRRLRNEPAGVSLRPAPAWGRATSCSPTGAAAPSFALTASVVYCPAVEATVAGTAGAGDAMAATFAAFVALGRPVDVALKAATLNAASVVAYIDTQSGLLRHDALEGRLAARSDLRLREWKLLKALS